MAALGLLGILGSVGCAQGTGLHVQADTPLRQFRIGVLTHPEKAEMAKFDENVVFADYMQRLGPNAPFEVEVVTDPAASGADAFISLNLDINYVTQVSRAADLPKILTLYLYAVLGFPTYKSSADFHLSAMLYDRDMQPINAWFVNEPVTFMWDNQYWAPDPLKPQIWWKAYNRLLNMMDRDIRLLQAGRTTLGQFPGSGSAGTGGDGN
ncbi:MAG: hypothetical protein AB7S36_16900 [Planctomycetota bacterium]